MTSAPKKPATSWRDVLKIHPAAEMFPRMSEDELRELGEDIKCQGQLTHPIVLCLMEDQTVQLVDGRNKLDAMEAVGIQFAFKSTMDKALWQLDADELELSHCEIVPPNEVLSYVISANVRRRHLTAEQKRELIAKLLKADPTKSNRQIAKMVDASHPHIAKVRTELEQVGDVETVTTSVDTRGRKQPAKKKHNSIISTTSAKVIEIAEVPAEQQVEAVSKIVGVDNAWRAENRSVRQAEKKRQEEKREDMAVEIERLAAKLVETDPESARALHKILWEEPRGALYRLMMALARGLGIDDDAPTWYAKRKARHWKSKACTECGATFTVSGGPGKGKRADARFCSDRCRQRAHRKAVTDKTKVRVEPLISRDAPPPMSKGRAP